MHLVTRNTPAPQAGTVLHLLHLSEDQQLSERLVRLISADATHWKGFDLLKQVKAPQMLVNVKTITAKLARGHPERNAVLGGVIVGFFIACLGGC